MNDLYRAVFNMDCGYYGSDQTFYRVTHRLREMGAPPVIFDNADRLRTPTLIDITRDVGDHGGSPIGYSCVGQFRQIVMAAATTSLLSQVKSRIAVDVALPSPSVQDARLLARELAEVEIENDLIAECFKRAGTSVRTLLLEFRKVEDAARISGLERIGRAQWAALNGDLEKPQIAEPRKALKIELAHQRVDRAGAA
jgi:hypothetical protein